MTAQLVVLGNPSCRRVGFWRAATAGLGWGFQVVAYSDLLRNCVPSFPSNSVVRIESPGEDWQTFKLLLKNGIESVRLDERYPTLDDEAIDKLNYERGWLIRPRQAHLGYLRLLKSVAKLLSQSGAAAMQSSEEVELCFDKPKCQAHLEQRGVPIPICLGSPRSYEELRKLARTERRVMVKLSHGSGAAGCVAIHWADDRARAITTVARMHAHGESRLYHSKRPIHLVGELEIADLVDRLCIEGVQAEVWLPKARWEGCNIDLRIVAIAGAPRHTAVRSSASPFTNFTVGGTRGDPAPIAKRMGREAWQRLRETCTSVAASFPASFTLGIDILVRPDWQRHSVLEVNAFGDLLLHSLDRDEDTYTATLNAWAAANSAEFGRPLRKASAQ